MWKCSTYTATPTLIPPMRGRTTRTIPKTQSAMLRCYTFPRLSHPSQQYALLSHRSFAMPRQPKPKPVGRPKLAKGEAKGKLVAVRFNPDDIKRIAAAAKASNQTLSEWIRGVASAATASN